MPLQYSLGWASGLLDARLRCRVSCIASYMVYYVGCLKGVSKSGQVLFNGVEAVIILTLIILK